jgi:hypothetical protein
MHCCAAMTCFLSIPTARSPTAKMRIDNIVAQCSYVAIMVTRMARNRDTTWEVQTIGLQTKKATLRHRLTVEDQEPYKNTNDEAIFLAKVQAQGFVRTVHILCGRAGVCNELCGLMSVLVYRFGRNTG